MASFADDDETMAQRIDPANLAIAGQHLANQNVQFQPVRRTKRTSVRQQQQLQSKKHAVENVASTTPVAAVSRKPSTATKTPPKVATTPLAISQARPGSDDEFDDDDDDDDVSLFARTGASGRRGGGTDTPLQPAWERIDASVPTPVETVSPPPVPSTVPTITTTTTAQPTMTSTTIPMTTTTSSSTASKPAPATTVKSAAHSEFVQTLPDRQHDFMTGRDTAEEYQDAYKPPYAPSLRPATLDKARGWWRMEILDQQLLFSMDWYDFLMEVKGITQRPESEFFIIQTPSSSAIAPQAVDATRRGISSQRAAHPARGQSADLLTGALSQFGYEAEATPLRDQPRTRPGAPSSRLPGTSLPGPTMGVGGAFGAIGTTGGATTTGGGGGGPTTGGAPLAFGSEAEESEIGAGPLTFSEETEFVQRRPGQVRRTGGAAQESEIGLGRDPGSLDTLLVGEMGDVVRARAAGAAAGVGGGAEQQTIPMGARYPKLRADVRDQIAKLHAEEWFVRDGSEWAAEVRRLFRVAGVRALPWIQRPLATGTFFLNPNYIAARRDALKAIRVCCGSTSLARVPLEEFMRRRDRHRRYRSFDDGGGDEPAWETVRSAFAKITAKIYLLNRYDSGVGLRHVHDSPQLLDQINGELSILRYRFGYDKAQRTFYDVGERNDERRLPTFMRPSERADVAYRSVLGTEYDGIEARAPSLLDIRKQMPHGNAYYRRDC